MDTDKSRTLILLFVLVSFDDWASNLLVELSLFKSPTLVVSTRDGEGDDDDSTSTLNGLELLEEKEVTLGDNS